MAPSKQPTTEEWLEILSPFDQWNDRVMMALLAVYGRPPSILDMGCGTGAMIEAAARNGVDALGIDKVVPEVDRTTEADGHLKTIRRDLSRPIDLGRKFSWGICLEVVEHIPEQYAGVVVNNIARHLSDGGWLFFSAAPPGQKGDGHVNLKPADWWRTMLHGRNMHWREDLTIRTRFLFDQIPMPMMWLAANLQVFSKQEPKEEEGEIVAVTSENGKES
jgi:SAM-dependent methyltransferase